MTVARPLVSVVDDEEAVRESLLDLLKEAIVHDTPAALSLPNSKTAGRAVASSRFYGAAMAGRRAGGGGANCARRLPDRMRP